MGDTQIGDKYNIDMYVVSEHADLCLLLEDKEDRRAHDQLAESCQIVVVIPAGSNRSQHPKNRIE